jgi:uncharacterized membrane protein
MSRRIGFGDRLLELGPFVLVTLCVAGIVHIVSVLGLPDLAQKHAFARLSALAQKSGLTILPRAIPGQTLLPFEDPAVARGICLFDLSQGPLHIRVPIEDEKLLTLSFRTRDGRIFYSMTDRAAVSRKIEVMVLTPTQLENLEAKDEDDQPPQELRLVAPKKQGFVLVNALAARAGEWAEAEARIRAVSCETEILAQ